jgi:hypothetical protein
MDNVQNCNSYINIAALPPSADCLENVGSSTSLKTLGLHGLLRGELFFCFTFLH